MSQDYEALPLNMLTALLSLVGAVRNQCNDEREKVLDEVSSMLEEAVELVSEGYPSGTLEFERAQGLVLKALAILDVSKSSR